MVLLSENLVTTTS